MVFIDYFVVLFNDLVQEARQKESRAKTESGNEEEGVVSIWGLGSFPLVLVLASWFLALSLILVYLV
jgi:hypothetical protein